MTLGSGASEDGYQDFARKYVWPMQGKLPLQKLLGVWPSPLTGRTENQDHLALEHILTIDLLLEVRPYVRFDTSERTIENAKAANQNQNGQSVVRDGLYRYTWSNEYHNPVRDSALDDLVDQGYLTPGQAIHLFKRAFRHDNGSTITPADTVQILVITSCHPCTLIFSSDGLEYTAEECGIGAGFILDSDTVLSAQSIAYVSLSGHKHRKPQWVGKH